MNAATKILYIEHKIEHWLLAFSLAAVCVLSVGYVYLLSMSVVHVVISREADERISDLQGEIAALESVYMEKQHAISTEVVENKGYVTTNEKIFLSRGNAAMVTRR